VKAIVAVIFISISVYIYNDVIDIEADKLNSIKKFRPLPSGKVAPEFARIVSIIAGLIGLTISITINIESFIFSLAYFILFSIYSYPKIHLKKKFILKESVVNAGFVLTGLIGSFAVTGTFSITVFYFSLINVALSFALQPPFNDTTDIEADKIQGVRSLAVVLSWKQKMQLLIIIILFVMTITPFTYTQFGFNMILPIYVVAGSLLLLTYMFPIIYKYEHVRATNARKLVVVYYFLLQLFAVFSVLHFNLIL